jgi:hypothetical protein
MKRKETTNDGYKQGAATNTGWHGDDANEKTGDKQGQWPEPPRHAGSGHHTVSRKDGASQQQSGQQSGQALRQ